MKFFELNKVSIITTGKCNLNCKYCYWIKDSRVLDTKKIGEIIKKIAETEGRQKRIVLVGGEPLLEKEVISKIINEVEIAKQNSGKEIKLILNTNGLLISDYSLEEMSKFDQIVFSIDGGLKTSLGGRVGSKEDYDKIVANVKKLGKIKDKLSINKVVTSKNLARLHEDVKEILSFGIPVNISVALGDAGWDEKIYFAYREELKKILLLMKKDKKSFRQLKSFFNIPIPYCPFSSLSIDPEGDMYNCEIMASFRNKKLGNIISDGLGKFQCEYKLYKPKCKNEECLECGRICTYSNFKKTAKDQKWYMKSLKLKRAILRNFIGSNNVQIPKKISIIHSKDIDSYKLTRIFNFIIAVYNTFSLKKSRNPDEDQILLELNSDCKDSAAKVEEESTKHEGLKSFGIKTGYEKNPEGKIIFDLDSEKIFLKEGEKNKKLLCYLNAVEVNLLDLIKGWGIPN